MSPEQSSVAHVEHLARDRDGHVVTEEQAWSALWALLIGFFMILVDTSIVTTALPATIRALNANLNQGVWITSAYLLTYAVPLLITGRMGDRWGPHRMYIIGMLVFGEARCCHGPVGSHCRCREFRRSCARRHPC